VARICEFHQQAGLAPQWYVGCRLMFVAEQLMQAVEGEVQVPRSAAPPKPPHARRRPRC